jgi:hypothetical protein
LFCVIYRQAVSGKVQSPRARDGAAAYSGSTGGVHILQKITVFWDGIATAPGSPIQSATN